MIPNNHESWPLCASAWAALPGVSVESGLVQAVLETLLAKSLGLGNVHWATSLVVGLMAAMCLGLGNAPGVTCLVVVGLEATLADVNDLVGSLEELLPLGGRC